MHLSTLFVVNVGIFLICSITTFLALQSNRHAAGLKQLVQGMALFACQMVVYILAVALQIRLLNVVGNAVGGVGTLFLFVGFQKHFDYKRNLHNYIIAVLIVFVVFQTGATLWTDTGRYWRVVLATGFNAVIFSFVLVQFLFRPNRFNSPFRISAIITLSLLSVSHIVRVFHTVFEPSSLTAEIYPTFIHTLFYYSLGISAVALSSSMVLLANERLLKKLEQMAVTDELTGLLNRRGMSEHVSGIFARSQRANSEVTVIMADIDKFKSINDTYGHPQGDEVIVAMANLLKGQCREGDIVARVGGEEFLLILPDTNPKMSVAVIDRMRLLLKEIELVHRGSIIKFTASFGISGGEPSQGFETFLQQSDKALYEAKETGRDRVVLFPF